MIEHDSNDDLGRPLSLLMASKTDYAKAVSLLSTLPGNTFTLMNSMECNGLSFHVMTMHINREKFQEFWYNLVQPNILESLVNYTVLAIVINCFTFIWLGGGKLTKRKWPYCTDNLGHYMTIFVQSLVSLIKMLGGQSHVT